jgi:hypothetical protein
MRKLLAALALFGAPLMAGQAMAAPVAAAHAKPLDRLVALLTPEQALLRLAGQAFDAGIRGEIATDPKLKAVQARHPGLTPYVAARLRPAFLKAIKKEIPSLRREIRAVAADGLTAPEIAEALTFFSSPAGMKLREQVYATMAEKPDQSPEQMQSAVMRAAMKNMKVADYPALIAFGASSAAGKMNAINPRIAAASKAWSERLAAKYSKRMRSLAAAAAKRYLKGRS